MAKSFDDLLKALEASHARSDRARRVDGRRKARRVVSDPDEYADDPAAVDYQDVDTPLTEMNMPMDALDGAEKDVLGKMMDEKDL